MHCHIRRLEVAATMAAVRLLLLWTPVVHAQAQGPGNLIGEDMIATSFVASSDYPACTAAVNYSVSGPAAGPYPGSFNQSGYFYASFPQASNYTYFQGTFHIDSAFGAVDGFGETDPSGSGPN